jgi:hypothetical protein
MKIRPNRRRGKNRQQRQTQRRTLNKTSEHRKAPPVFCPAIPAMEPSNHILNDTANALTLRYKMFYSPQAALSQNVKSERLQYIPISR